MALTQLYVNNAATYLKEPLGGSSSDNTIFIIDTDNDKFPAPVVGSEYFLATLENVQTKEWEIVSVSNRVGNQLTVTRGQEGSAIKAFPLGSKIQVRVTKETLERLYNQSAAISNFVHNQQTLANTWLVNHNLGRIPNVSIEVGQWISGVFNKEASAEATINHIDTNSFSITFSESVMGRVICT